MGILKNMVYIQHSSCNTECSVCSSWDFVWQRRNTIHDFMLPPWSRWEMCSSGQLHSEW